MRYYLYLTDGQDSHGFYVFDTLEEAKAAMNEPWRKSYDYRIIEGVEVD